MNAKPVTVLAMALVLSGMFLVTMTSDGSDAAVRSVSVAGIICEVGDSDPVPSPEVTVTLVSNGTEYTGETDENGRFTIPLTVDTGSMTVQFRCSVSGYSIFGLPDCMSTVNGTTYIDLNEVTPELVSGTYVYNTCSDTLHSILLSDTAVTVTFTVTDIEDSKVLRHAEITLINKNLKFSGTTNEDGICSFSSKIPIGDYSLSVHCDGYESYSAETFTISKTSTQSTVQLTSKEMTTYLGLTLYHLLMVFGVVLGLVLVVISYVLCTRSWKKTDSNDGGDSEI